MVRSLVDGTLGLLASREVAGCLDLQCANNNGAEAQSEESVGRAYGHI